MSIMWMKKLKTTAKGGTGFPVPSRRLALFMIVFFENIDASTKHRNLL